MLSRPASGDRALVYHKRRRHFRRKRAYAEAFKSAGYDRIAEALASCEETEQLVCCSHCSGHWWVLSRCRLRVCPLCSYKIAKDRARYIQSVTMSMQHPKMLTLTVPRWKTDPRDGIAFLRKSFNRLRRQKVMRTVTGGAYTIELKRKQDGWHIHIHAMLDTPYIHYRKLWTAWREITQIPVPQIDIRSADTKEARAYLCKDASKVVAYDCNPADIVAWYEATKGQRLWATFGKWYNASYDSLGLDDPKDVEPVTCPHCGATRTAFFARDGPRIYGHEDWRSLEPVFLPDGHWRRPVPEASEYIDNPHPELDQDQGESSPRISKSTSQADPEVDRLPISSLTA